MSDFFRFPHTSHLVWLGEGVPRDDKVLADDEVDGLLAGEVVVEEKVDGANIGFSVGPDGAIRVQNRGQYLDPEHSHPQFRPLWSWLPSREPALIEALPPGRILFGEWCHAVHSVEYDRLPDWFLGFDLYDGAIDGFWDTARRDRLLQELGLVTVPRVGRGEYTLADLVDLLAGPSRVSSAGLEGVIVRKEEAGQTTLRAKLVRAQFTQAIEEHWSRAPMRRNTLAPGANPWG